ncbi:MAG: hypothetical protein QJR07_12340 [Acetobacteraceae bacterium]|nr:hypothetical protein [Acetobacteraceae bacterium]
MSPAGKFAAASAWRASVSGKGACGKAAPPTAPGRGRSRFSDRSGTGCAAPRRCARRIFEQAHRIGGHRFAFHGHDTYGMGVANVAAAYEAGCRIFDAASGGIGGCPFAPGATGNVAMEDVVWLFRRMGVETGVDWQKLLVAADLAAAVPGATPGGAMRRVPAARQAA